MSGGIPEPPGRLVLVRHGETEWSASGKHTGRTDVPLTPAGVAQAEALRLLLERITPVAVFTSPRTRARHTAQLAGYTDAVIDPDLSEWDYGDYEGITTPQIRETVPGWTVWTHPSPNGETGDEVSARCDRFLRRVFPLLDGGDVVVFAHGHLLRALTARWLQLPVAEGGRLALGTATIGVLGHEHGNRSVDRWNIPNPASDVL
jgi:probable phosphoglycerate mutase